MTNKVMPSVQLTRWTIIIIAAGFLLMAGCGNKADDTAATTAPAPAAPASNVPPEAAQAAQGAQQAAQQQGHDAAARAAAFKAARDKAGSK